MSTIANSPRAWNERATIAEPWAAGLQSQYAQTHRFLAALRHLDLRPHEELLDFGCGTGELARFLPANVAYYAYDWAPELRDRARADHPRAIVLDELPAGETFDHVVAIGPFNLADGWSVDQTRLTIEDLWRRTERTLLVSLLRPRADTASSPDVLRYEPSLVAGWAAAIATRWQLDASYLDNDVLLVMRKS